MRQPLDRFRSIIMEAREDLPKISIETEQDWKRIQHNLSAVFLARLDTELESHGQFGDKDVLLPHVHQFFETLSDIARPNLRINGRTTDDPFDDEDDVEPFDEALDRHIWSLSDQRLKWDKEIADHRRTGPNDLENLVSEILAQHHLQNADAPEIVDAYADTNHIIARQVDCELRETLLNAASLSPDLLQSIKSQRARVNEMRSVSTEVKALKS